MVGFAPFTRQGFGKDSGYYERNIKSWSRLSRQQARVKNLDDGREVGDAYRLDDQVAWFEKNMWVASQRSVKKSRIDVVLHPASRTKPASSTEISTGTT